jgi:disulfide bond formation protein DsbB
MTQFSSRQFILAATLASVALIVGAWIFQALGYAPCELCLLQRNPHYVAIGIGAVAWLTRWRWLAWPGAAALATTSAIGFYHSGVERKWWPGPTSCTGGGDIGGLSADDLLAQLQSTPVVMCDQIPWRLSDMIPLQFLDITMANFNAIGSLVLVFIWIAAARRA